MKLFLFPSTASLQRQLMFALNMSRAVSLAADACERFQLRKVDESNAR
jgi:hypothetical protein